MFRIGFRSRPCRSLPIGYLEGQIDIAGTSETIGADLSFWNAAEYVEHWRETARRAGTAKDLVFATSLSPRDGGTLWCMRRFLDEFVCINMLCAWDSMLLDGQIIHLVSTPDENDFLKGDVSTWAVALEELDAFSTQSDQR